MQAFKYQSPQPAPQAPRPTRGVALRVAAIAVVLATGAWAWREMPRGVALGWADAGRAARANAPRADEAFRRAQKDLAAGMATDAIKGFDAALRLDPTLTEAYQRGLDARALADQAPAALETLLPDAGARVAFLLAQARVDEPRHAPAALDDLDRALAVAPKDPHVLRARAELLARMGEPGAAIAAYEQALRILPDDLPLAAGLVALRFKAGNLDQAINEARTRLQPYAGSSKEPVVHEALALAALEQGQTPDLSRAPLTESQRRLALARAAMAHYQENPNWHRGSFEHTLEAVKALLAPEAEASAAERLAGETLLVEALATRARKLADRGQLEPARATLDQALALRPRLVAQAPALTARFADLYVARAHLGPEGEVTNKALEAAVVLVPHHPVRAELARIYANLGVSMLGAKKALQALKPLDRAVQLDPENVGVLAHYHQALVRSGAAEPLATCMRAAGQPDRGAMIASLIEGYVVDKERATASRVFELTSHGLTPAARRRAALELMVANDQWTAARQGLLAIVKAAPTLDGWRRLVRLDRQLAKIATGEKRLPAYQQARADALQALAMSGEQQDRAIVLGLAHTQVLAALDAGDDLAAKQVAEEALGLEPRNASLGLALATAQQHGGNIDGAIAACRAALAGVASEADPLEVALRERLGTLYRGQKRYAEAVEEYRRALAASPPPREAAELTFGLALAHAGANEREAAINAIRQYEAIARRDPRQAVRVATLQALEHDLARKTGG